MKNKTIVIFGVAAMWGAAISVSGQAEPQRQAVQGVPVVVRQSGQEDIPEFSIRQRQLEMELEEARREIRGLREQLAEAQTPDGRKLRAERRLERAEADRERLNEERRELRASLRETQAQLKEVEKERDSALGDAQKAQDQLEHQASRDTGRRSGRRGDPDEETNAVLEERVASLQEMVQTLRAELAGQMQLTANYREFAQTAAEEMPPDTLASADEDLIDQGLQAFEAGDLRRARRLLERASRQHDEDAALHGYLGAVYFSQGQHARAQKSLERAVTLDPVNPAMHFNLAVLLASLDPPELRKASLHYQESLRLGGSEDVALQARLDGE